MYERYPKFFAQSAMALGLSAVLAGCGQNDDAQARQSAPVPAAQQSPAPSSATSSPPAETAVPQASAAAAGHDGPAVATLGAVSVSQAELQSFLRALPAAQREAMSKDRVVMEQWLRSRLAEKAVVEQARNQDWQQKPEVRRAIEEAQNQVILRSYLLSVSEPAADYPSEQELQTAYESNKAQFQVPAMYRISQIFLASQEDGQALAQARKQAESLVRQLRDGKAQFAKLASEYSDEQTSAQRGGDTGYVPMAQLVPAMRTIVAKMSVGQVSDPIVQPGGVHILQLTDVRQATVRPLDEVKPALRDALRRQRQQEAAQAYLSGMLDTATVAVDGKALSAALGGGDGPK